MIAGFSRNQSRFPIFLSFSLSFSFSHADPLPCSTNTHYTHTHWHRRTAKCSCSKCVQIGHLDCNIILFVCVYFPFPALILSLSSLFSLCLRTHSLCQVCASISSPHCPVSCHPFTLSSSLCHHQGPGGLLRSASEEKGLYLSNAPSNRSS